MKTERLLKASSPHGKGYSLSISKVESKYTIVCNTEIGIMGFSGSNKEELLSDVIAFQVAALQSSTNIPKHIYVIIAEIITDMDYILEAIDSKIPQSPTDFFSNYFKEIPQELESVTQAQSQQFAPESLLDEMKRRGFEVTFLTLDPNQSVVDQLLKQHPDLVEDFVLPDQNAKKS